MIVKKKVKEGCFFVILMLMILPTISAINNTKVEQYVLNNNTVLDIQFYQMDFKFDGTLYENTDWGSVDLFYVGQEPIMYFNLVVNGAWQVQNIPVLSSEGTNVDQIMTYYFDLGNEVGNEVTSVSYGYDFTDDILTSIPPEPYTAPVVSDIVILNAGSDGEMPDLSEAKPLIGAKATTPEKHSHSNFPNQECGSKECAPAAVSNSLKFLNTKHNLGLTDAQTSIATMKTAVGFKTGKGSPLDTWWENKKKYMKDNNYPIVTRKITDISKLAAEIDAGQDVEIQESWIKNGNRTGHTTALKGITKMADGNYSLEIVDDRKQGQTGGTDKPRTYTYNPATGKFYEAGFGYTKFEYAVVECPDLPKWTYHFKFAGCPGGLLQVYGTHNCVRQVPPLFNDYAKFCDIYQGYVPKTIGGNEINDIIFDFYWDFSCNNEDHIKFASPSWNDETGMWKLTSLDKWIEANVDTELLLTSVGDPTGAIQQIHAIVNLDEYQANPVPPMDTYEIINGECEDLPGYLIGVTPIVFDPLVGPYENPFFTIPLEYGLLHNDGEITLSPIPNESPFAPNIDGTTGGKPNVEYDYTLLTTDPEDEDVYYYVDWGDSTNSGWLGPHISGQTIIAKHTWSVEGEYEIKTKSKDVFNDESEWSDPLIVNMPRDRTINLPFFKLLHQYPILFQLIKLVFNITK
jgi:hypothetical protein